MNHQEHFWEKLEELETKLTATKYELDFGNPCHERRIFLKMKIEWIENEKIKLSELSKLSQTQ